MPPRNSINWVERMMVLGDAGGLDQFLLGDLGAEIAIVAPVGSDDGERDMVPDAGCGLSREKVTPGGLEDSSTALSSNEGELARSMTTCAPAVASLRPSPVMVLTPLLGEAANDVVATLAQNGDGLRADQAGAADDDDLHGLPSLSMTGRCR